MTGPAPSYAHALPSTAAACETALAGQGQALSPDLRAHFEAALGGDLSGVRLHTGAAAAAAAERAGARAFTIGQDIAFAAGAFRPGTPDGLSLLGHEIVHVAQGRRGGRAPVSAAEAEAEALAPGLAGDEPVAVRQAAPPGPAFALEDYFNSSPGIGSLPLTRVQEDIDEITEYLDRQFETNETTGRLQQALDELHQRKAELLGNVAADPKPPRRNRRSNRRRGRRAAEQAPLPDDAPRILRERGSVQLEDPAEVRLEIDRTVAWLQRDDVSSADRQILRDHLHFLAPQHEALRQQDSAQRHSARVQAAFRAPRGGGEAAGAELSHHLSVVESIYTDPAEPDVRFILDDGERVRISQEQADRLVADSRRELNRAILRAQVTAEGAVEKYRAQTKINEDQYIVSTIADWLSDVEDPGLAVIRAKIRADAGVQTAREYLRRGDLSSVVAPLVRATEAALRLDAAVDAWVDGLIEGASLAANVLTFVRDASFAIATAIAAVVAAPVVAGYVAGLGVTGASATILTTAGSGLVVGTGAGVAGGGAEYVGQRAAGASHAEASRAAAVEGRRRFAEGAAAGTGGAATRVVGQAVGVGRGVGHQVARRGAAELAGNVTGTVVGGTLQGQSAEQIVSQSVRSGGIGLLGNAAGSLGRTPLAQEAIEFGSNAALTTADTLAHGGSVRDAALNLTVMTASQGAITRLPGVQQQLAGHQQRGQWLGARHRAAATNLAGATALGLQLSVPPLRIGAGGTSRPAEVATSPEISQVAARETAVAARPGAPEAPAARRQGLTQATNTHEVFAEVSTELGLSGSATATQRPGATVRERYQSAQQDAQQAGWVDAQGNPQGPVHGVVGEHRHASTRREVQGHTGQSVHGGPVRFFEQMPGYGENSALTQLLDRRTHTQLDRGWKNWLRRMRRERPGGTVTLREAYEAHRDALLQVSATPRFNEQQLGTYISMMQREYAQWAADLPNGWNTPIPVDSRAARGVTR